MPWKAYYMSPEGVLQCDLNEDEVRHAFQSEQGFLWVDVVETTEADGQFLEQTFGFHHLAVEDCVSERVHPPKTDDFDGYLFTIVHGINHMTESEIVETAELAVFLGPHFVVSNHNSPLYSIEAIRRQVESDGRPMRRAADFLAYTLMDALVDNVLPTIDKMSEIAEEIEEETIRNPQQTVLEAIIKLKRSTLRIHRVMAPQREALNRLSRGDFPLISTDSRIYFRDVYDHLVRIEDLNQTIRDRADNALNTYLSSLANRQNETMRVLSIVATIFLPLTLVAGIYGMNFDNMPELRWTWGYFAVLGFMGVVIAAVVWRLWARRWITWGRRQVRWVRPFTVEPEKLTWHAGKLTGWPRRHTR